MMTGGVSLVNIFFFPQKFQIVLDDEFGAGTGPGVILRISLSSLTAKPPRT